MTTSSTLNILLSILLPFLTFIAHQAVAAIKVKAAAVLSAEERATLYAAVKVGVRVAKSYGVDVEGTRNQLEQAGIEAAARYLSTMGFNAIDPKYLRDLLHAEWQKSSASTVPGSVELIGESAPLEIPDKLLDAAVQRWFFDKQQPKGVR